MVQGTIGNPINARYNTLCQGIVGRVFLDLLGASHHGLEAEIQHRGARDVAVGDRLVVDHRKIPLLQFHLRRSAHRAARAPGEMGVIGGRGIIGAIIKCRADDVFFTRGAMPAFASWRRQLSTGITLRDARSRRRHRSRSSTEITFDI